MNLLEEKNMKDNSIVAEVRKNRRSIFESYDWDFEKMSRDVMKRQWESDHKVVSPKKREPQPGVAPNAYSLRKKA